MSCLQPISNGREWSSGAARVPRYPPMLRAAGKLMFLLGKDRIEAPKHSYTCASQHHSISIESYLEPFESESTVRNIGSRSIRMSKVTCTINHVNTLSVAQTEWTGSPSYQ